MYSKPWTGPNSLALSRMKGLTHSGVLAIENPIPDRGYAGPMRLEFFEKNCVIHVWLSILRIKVIADSEYPRCVRGGFPIQEVFRRDQCPLSAVHTGRSRPFRIRIGHEQIEALAIG